MRTSTTNKSSSAQCQVATAVHHSPLVDVLHPCKQARLTQPLSETRARDYKTPNSSCLISISSSDSRPVGMRHPAGRDHTGPLLVLAMAHNLSIGTTHSPHTYSNCSKRPCKIQCTFYCHRIDKIISPLFVYVGHPPLGSK